MKTAVRYFSRSGNTKLLADAVATAVGVEAKTVEADVPEKADILFLGSSLYAGNFDPAVSAFIERNADKIGTIVCFGSSASGKSTFAKIQKLAQNKGIPVSDRFFNCPGHFLFLHKDRPNKEDAAAVAAFAKSFL